MRPDSSHYIVTSWWPLHDLTNLTVSGTDTQRIFKMRKSEYLSEMENIEVRWTMFFAGDVAYITTPSNHGPLSMGPWVIVRRLWRWIGSHNRTRAIARYPWLNGISKREFPQKLNLRHYNELALQKVNKGCHSLFNFYSKIKIHCIILIFSFLFILNSNCIIQK